jgi:serine phosphatase RsbU (regulator of sigma subunit)
MKVLYFILLILVSTYSFSQEKGLFIGQVPVQNFKPKEYLGHPQVNCVVKDSRGVLYFGNNGGVSIYDGTKWESISIKDDKRVESIFISKQDEIFIGSEGDFGQLQVAENGKLNYRSMSENLNDSIQISTVFGITKFGESVLFSTFEYLFIYNGKNVKAIPAQGKITDIYKVDSRIYIHLEAKGLYHITYDNQLLPYVGNETLKGKKINDVISYDKNGIMIITSDSIFLSHKNKITRKHFPIDTEIKGFQTSCKFNEEDFLISTGAAGVLRVNKKGQILETYNVEYGIISNSIREMCVTNDGNVALATENGISIVNYLSPVRKVGEMSNIHGPMEKVFSNGEYLFVVGKEGIFQLNHSQNNTFIELDNLGQRGYGGGVVNGENYFIMYDGVYKLQNAKLKEFGAIYAWSILQIDSSHFLIGGEKELFEFELQNGKWELLNKHTIDYHIKSMELDKEGTVWLGSFEGNGINRFLPKYSSKLNSKEELIYYSVDQVGCEGDIKVFKANDQVLFSTEKGIREFDSKSEKFVITEAYGNFVKSLDKTVYLSYYEGGRLWILYSADKSKMEFGYVDQKGTWHTENFNKLKEDFIYSFASTKDLVWMATADGLYSYRKNYQTLTTKTFKTYFKGFYEDSKKEHFGNFIDENGFLFQKEEELFVFNYAENVLKFEFGAINYQDSKNTQYQFFLEGFDPNWREWTNEYSITFTNLPAGEYTLHFRAINSSGVISDESSIKIKVLPPWYEEWWFRISVLVLIVVLIYMLFKARTASLRRQQLVLENTVMERTAEIEEQKVEVEKQRDIAKQEHQHAEEQKLIVEHKNMEILDSIKYAKRLQEAILPPISKVKEWLNDSFLFYRPKDIVAGDFYWMEVVNTKIDDKEKSLVFFAAADCTGHGVPGAMVSVVCANALNRAIKEFKLTNPGAILDKVTELVVQSFDQGVNEIKDGMDIALCAYDKKERKIYFSGANNPLYLITKNSNNPDNKYVNESGELELIEIKANRQPVGKYDHMEKFDLHSLQLQKGDLVYLFSDGYPDQFGGEKGKKYKYSTFKRLLLKVASNTIDEQFNLIEKEFDDWKQGHEQVDDVCVIGVRIE